MAKKPKKDDNEQNATPDFKGAADIIRSTIRNVNDTKAKALGDLSAAWARVQDNCHVNKKAAKAVAAIMGMSDGTRSDYLRSLLGLLNEMKLGISSDLVDLMGGTAALAVPVNEVANETELED